MTNNQQNQTGYPSIDKPWMKYYKKFDDDFINETAYDCLRRNCNNPKGNAISFYGNNISYESLFEHIASTRAAIVKFGVKKGDVVCVCLPNIPEAIYIFYALNSLGAIANYLDVRLNPQEFHEELTISRSNLLFLFDDCVPGYLEKINKISTLKKAVSISVSESLPFNKKIIYNLSKMKSSAKNSKLINWNNFIEKIGDSFTNMLLRAII